MIFSVKWNSGVEANCEKNFMQIPEGSTPLYAVFEEYAKDQDKWINEFIPTFEKMMSNGYDK